MSMRVWQRVVRVCVGEGGGGLWALWGASNLATCSFLLLAQSSCGPRGFTRSGNECGCFEAAANPTIRGCPSWATTNTMAEKHPSGPQTFLVHVLPCKRAVRLLSN